MPLPPSPMGCPMDALLRLLMGPWTTYILWALRQNGVMRFGAIRRTVQGVSAKVLTERLRMLEKAYTEKQDTQEKQDSGAPVEQDPADVEEKNDRDQAGAESDEKCDRPAPAGENHTLSLCLREGRLHLEAGVPRLLVARRGRHPR